MRRLMRLAARRTAADEGGPSDFSYDDPRFAIPPSQLQPTPLPDDQQSFKPPPDNSEDLWCPICWDFLEKPVGCGHCVARFCSGCLDTYCASSSQQRPAFCPICRQVVRRIRIRDFGLIWRMKFVKTPCRLVGCDCMDIPLTNIKLHESQCSAVRVACRYAVYGCAWTGRRGESKGHEETDCSYGKVSGLIGEFFSLHQRCQTFERENAALREELERALHSKQGASRRQSEVPGLSNPLHIAAFATLVCVWTPRFLSRKYIWKNLYRTVEGRARVLNTLAVFPTVLLCVKIALRCFEETALNSEVLVDVETVYLVCQVLAWTALVVVLVCTYSLGFGRKVPFVETLEEFIPDFLLVSLVSLAYGTAMNLSRCSQQAVLIWCGISYGTILYPCVLVHISLLASEAFVYNSTKDMVSASPIFARLYGGLILSPATFLMGFTDGLFNSLFVLVLFDRWRRKKLSTWNAAAIFSAVPAGVQWAAGEAFRSRYYVELLGLLCLLYGVWIIQDCLLRGSAGLGIKIFRLAEKKQHQGIHDGVTGLGVLVFAAWICSLITLLRV